jgi:hypothetical protein
MAQIAAFTQVLTAQAIVQAADREAGSPGLYLTSAGTETLAAHAYVALQSLLDHLAQAWDWPFRNDALSLQVSTRTTELPSDYWRATFNGAFLVDPITNRRYPLQLLGSQEFHEGLIPAEEGTGRPSSVQIIKNSGSATGGSPHGVLYTDIVPDRTYFIELHYSPLAVPLAAITTKPWFPWSYYLIKALAVELFVHQDDNRRADVAAERDRLFRDIRRSLSEPGQRANRVRYNTSVFRDPVRI